MIYRVIGLMSGSSLDGLDIAYVHFHENAGKWSFDIMEADCYPYTDKWLNRLQSATHLNALDYQLLHADYGHYLGEQVNTFINKHQLHYQVQLIASHGHTTFHVPEKKMTGQLGDGAAIAAETGLPVVSDLRALDVALGGQGAPIVPIGDKLLLYEYDYCLNLGGIANLSAHDADNYVSFDICSANRILDQLVAQLGKAYDEDGKIAQSGAINKVLLDTLNELPYYSADYPKSLANNFGNEVVLPIILSQNGNLEDNLRTYVEHIAIQIKRAVSQMQAGMRMENRVSKKMLVTGGGAFNRFLIARIGYYLEAPGIELVVPSENIIKYKEAVVMGLMGVLRWREENNVLASVTGSLRNSVGGAIWMGAGA
ncbi:MAG TPA: anhydro-N-acetylmuramic acid kinase [Agriterribacter sp.]|nr:anhydro-N-acetylmuramic acid kinase [Agriterribacter sp.]